MLSFDFSNDVTSCLLQENNFRFFRYGSCPLQSLGISWSVHKLSTDNKLSDGSKSWERIEKYVAFTGWHRLSQNLCMNSNDVTSYLSRENNFRFGRCALQSLGISCSVHKFSMDDKLSDGSGSALENTLFWQVNADYPCRWIVCVMRGKYPNYMRVATIMQKLEEQLIRWCRRKNFKLPIMYILFLSGK